MAASKSTEKAATVQAARAGALEKGSSEAFSAQRRSLNDPTRDIARTNRQQLEELKLQTAGVNAVATGIGQLIGKGIGQVVSIGRGPARAN